MAENRRTLEFQIGTEEDGMTVQEFLKKNLSFSARQISRLKFRQDGIRVNGEQYYVTWQLRAGDHLEIGLQDDRKPARTGWLTQEEAAKIALNNFFKKLEFVHFFNILKNKSINFICFFLIVEMRQISACNNTI